MTPKEKAKELFDKYQIAGSQWYVETTKKYALIAVDEIIQEMNSVMLPNPFKQYWNDVKQEIEKL